MRKKDEKEQIIAEMFQNAKITCSQEQMNQIYEDIICDIQMQREINSYPNRSSTINYDKLIKENEAMKAEILRLKNEIETHQNSVKIRRNASDVYVQNGKVMFE